MIEVKSLSKNFGAIKAVDDVTFQVAAGEVLGFLGPNGAGKSTTMKILACFLDPSSGDATICGKSILEDPIFVRKNIGYMPENAPLYDELTVNEFLQFIADVRGLQNLQRHQEILQLCALQEVADQMIETLSKGYRRRVSLAQALLHDPAVLILDEPTDGLDPNQKHEVRDLIKKLATKKCVILSTHILEEVEAVCSRAIIIAKGKLLFDGTPGELKRKSQNGKIDDVFRALTTGSKVEGVSL